MKYKIQVLKFNSIANKYKYKMKTDQLLIYKIMNKINNRKNTLKMYKINEE